MMLWVAGTLLASVSYAADIEQIQIDVGEYVFDARAAGPADGELVILLHGFPETSYAYRNQLQALGDEGFRAVAPDQRGYSQGVRPAAVESYAMPHLVGDVLGIAAALGHESFHLVGHDWGGAVAWVTAALHPERVKSLVALSTPHVSAFAAELANPDSDQAKRSSYFASFTAAGAEHALLANDAARLRAIYGSTAFTEADVARYLEVLGSPGALGAALNWYRASGLTSGSGAPASALPPIRVPTLYVWSNQDGAFAREPAERTADFVDARYRFEELDGVSHWVMEEAPARVSALILEHLAGEAGAAKAAQVRDVPSARARALARRALETQTEPALATLAELVGLRTVYEPEMANAENPEFQALSRVLAAKAAGNGLDFHDYGAVVVLGLGQGPDRLGLVTHADVQPADPSKWARNPFQLDTESEPGRLVGRGVEDDKAPIALAIHAMAALKEQALPLRRRIELIVSYTEESDWDLFQEFLVAHPPPQINVGFDAEFPVVIAEKGWGTIHISLPDSPVIAEGPYLVSLSGGAFLSQVPEDAVAEIASATPALEERLRKAASAYPELSFEFTPEGPNLVVRARGHAAHSSTPWDGRNAITHLAAVLSSVEWPATPASRMAQLIDDLIGTGDLAERFGTLAYTHPFMGPLTLTLATLRSEDGRLIAGINIRRPAGRTREQVEATILTAVEGWKEHVGTSDLQLELLVLEPHYPAAAPHIPVLLDIFRAFTGQSEAQPISIGGGTHARLLPNGVNFGPGMPGEVYTGHTEHEFMSVEQFRLNLQMVAALLVELAGS
jgi:dipeptidase D